MRMDPGASPGTLTYTMSLIPAKAGIQSCEAVRFPSDRAIPNNWIPAFAGMSEGREVRGTDQFVPYGSPTGTVSVTVCPSA